MGLFVRIKEVDACEALSTETSLNMSVQSILLLIGTLGPQSHPHTHTHTHAPQKPQTLDHPIPANRSFFCLHSSKVSISSHPHLPPFQVMATQPHPGEGVQRIWHHRPHSILFSLPCQPSLNPWLQHSFQASCFILLALPVSLTS